MSDHGTSLHFVNSTNVPEAINVFSDWYGVDFGEELLYYRELVLQCISPLLDVAAQGAYTVDCEYEVNPETFEESYKFKNSQTKILECLLILAHGTQFSKDNEYKTNSFEMVEGYLEEVFELVAKYRTEDNTRALRVSVLQLLKSELIRKCYDVYLMETLPKQSRSLLLLIPKNPDLLAIRIDMYMHLPLSETEDGRVSTIH